MQHTIFSQIKRFALLFLVSVLAVAAVQFILFWNQSETAEAAGGGRTVFYKNTGNWGAVQIHYWNSNGSPTGTNWGSNPPMTSIGGTGASQWFAYTIPGATNGPSLLFRDGGSNQSADSHNRNTDAWFANGTWTSSNPDTDSTAPTFWGQPWISGNSTNGTSVNVNFWPASDNSGIEKYELLRDGSVVSTLWAVSNNSNQNASAAYTIPASYSIAQSGLTSGTTYKFEVRTYDYKGNTVMSPAIYVNPGAYTKTLTLDGTNDFAASETFTSSNAGHPFYLTWDGNYIYYGYNGADVNSTTSNANLKWVISYIGGSSGSTTGINYGGQEPTLQFGAKHHIRLKVDGTYGNRQFYNGTTWTDGGNLTWGTHMSRNGNMLEFRIPRSDFNLNGTTLQWNSSILYESTQGGGGAMWAAVPNNTFTGGEGWDKDFGNYYEFDLTSSTPAGQQWSNYEFRQTSKAGKSVTFSMKGGFTSATTVKIQQSTNGGVSWSDSTLVSALSASSTSAIVKGLTPSTSYKFRLVVAGGTVAGSSTVESVTTTTNAAPTASAGTLTTNEDTAGSGTLSGSDVDYDSITYSIVSQPASGGTVSITNASTGAYTFTPSANFNGSTTFTFKTNDGTADSTAATVTVTVTAVNDAPTITNIVDQAVNEDVATSAIAFTIGDVETAATSLTVTGSSSNTTLVPNANISIAGSGASRTVTVTPAANLSGTATITITVSDGSLTTTDTFVITVTAVNDNPTISDVANVSVNEDTATSAISVTVGDVETAAGSLTVTGSSSNTALVPNANIVFGGSGASRTVTITPAANQSGTATITLTVSDGSGSATDTFVVTVVAVNDAPTISNVVDSSTNEDTATSAIAITVNDIDSTVANLTMSGSSSNTTLVPDVNIVFGGTGANRTVTITPAANQTGTATITLTVSDGSLTASDTFVLTVTAVNDGPTITDITNKTTNEDTATSAITVTVNDIDTTLNSLTVTATSSNTTIVPNGNISITGTGGSRSMTITPAANQNGTVTITVTVSDGSLTATDTFDLVISAVNDAPTISDIANISTNEDTATSAISFTISDLETAATSLTVSGTSSNTTLVPNVNIVFAGTTGSRTATITPAANQNGSTTITITVSDGTLTATDTFTLTVNAVNDAPTATAGSLSTSENVAANGNLAGTDIEGSTLTYAIVTQPAKGTVSLNNATGAYTYTPSTSLYGSDSFTFKVNDGTSDSATATISITITAVNDAPVASNGTLNATEDTEATGTLSATDTDGDPLVYSVVAQGSKGTVTITNTATGAYKYVPNANANGSDSFTFKVNDGVADSNTATITVTITAVNDAPTSSNGTLSATEDTTATGTLVGSDVEGSSLTYSIVANGSKGTVTITNAATGAYSYVPNANANGSDTFTFRVSDGGEFSSNATITVTITAVNDAPVASSGTLSATEDTTATGSLTANDIDSANLTYTIITNGSKGTVTITNAATGAYSYVPNANATGSDTFTFRVSDGTDNSNTATITVNITAVNDAPTLTTVSTLTGATEDTGYSIGFSALAAAANEADVDGDTLSFKIVAISTGTLTINGAPATAGTSIVSTGDTLVWTPAANANGTLNAFTIVANDGLLDSASAVQVSVTVTAVNDAPTLTSISNLTGGNENQTYEITYDSLQSAANEADVEGSTISFRIEAVSSGTLTKGGVAVTAGTTLLGPGESLIWTPALNAEGTSAAFTVIASDGSATSTTPITVNVVLSADTAAPSVPVGFTAVNITKNSFRIQWNAVNDSPSLGTVKYIVRFNNVDLESTTNTYYEFPLSGATLSENTNYAGITVKAVDEAGNISNATTAITVRTLDGTNPNPTPGTPTISDKTGAGFNVSWTAATDNIGGSGIKEYEVMVGANMYGPTASTSIVITGLDEYTVYEVKIRAVDNDGNKSAWGTSINPRTNDVTAPTAPSGVSESNVDATTFTVNWSASTDNVQVSGYNVYLNGVKKNAELIVATTFNVTGVTRNVPYAVVVKGVDSSGNESAGSTSITVTPVDVSPPTAPSGLATTSKNFTAFGLTWTASTDNVEVAGYNIYVNGTKHGFSATTTYNVTGVAQGNTYTVVVKAYDLDDNESTGATLEVPLTDFDKPIWPGTENDNGAAIVRTLVSRTFSSLTVSWTAATDVVEGVAGTGVGGYSVTVTSPTAGASGTGTFDTNTNQITLTNLRPDTTYVLSIQAYDNAANFSEPQTRFAKTNGATSHPTFEAKTTVDVVVPTTPADLEASNITSKSVDLEWAVSTDNDSVAGYNVYVQLKLLDGTYRSSQLINNTPINDDSYTINGLTPNKEYRIVVRAVDRAGNLSAVSNVEEVTTSADTEGPTLTAVAEVTADSTNAVQERTIKIDWLGSFADNVDTNLTYEVYVDNVKIATANPITATDFLITGLTPDTEYEIRVKAFDRSGNESDQSTPTFTVTTLEDNVKPSKPVATVSTPTATSVKVSWTISTDTIGAIPRTVYSGLAVAKYRIYLGTPDGETVNWDLTEELNVPLSKLEYTITGLTRGTTGYKVKVTAVDAAGNESVTVTADEKTFNTTADTIKPSNPTNLRINQVPGDATKLNFVWTASTDNDVVAGYKIFTISSVPGTSENWVERTVSNIVGTSYQLDLTTEPYSSATAIRLRVVAYDAAGNASANDVATDKVGFLVRYNDVTAPTAPTSVEAKSTTATGFNLSWKPSTDGATGSGIARYEVYQDGVLIGTTNTTTFLVTGLTPQTTYNAANENGFSIKAFDVAGNASAEVLLDTVTTLEDLIAPTTPVVKLQSKSFDRLVFEFTNSTDNVAVASYQYRVANTATGFTNELEWSATTSPITITGLSLNTTRFIQVRAVDTNGKFSVAGIASGTTDIDKTVPTAPPIVTAIPYVSSVLVSWSPGTDNTQVVGYRVYRLVGTTLTQLSTTLPATARSFEVTKLNAHDDAGTVIPVTADTNYSFVVRTVDLGGNLSVNTSATVKTLKSNVFEVSPPVISVKTVVNETEGEDGNKFTIQWSAPVGVTVKEYEFFLNGVSVAKPANGSIIQWTFEKLASSTTFVATVLTHTSDNQKLAFSNSVSQTTVADTMRPTLPTTVVAPPATVGAGSIRLNFSGATDNVAIKQYLVYNGETLLATKNVTSSSDHFVIVSGLTPSTAYSFTVKTVDTSDNISLSATDALNVSTTTDTKAPNIPTALTASSPTRTGTVAGFTVSWTAPADDVAVTGYTVFVNGIAVTPNVTDGTSYTFTNLVYNTQYRITVLAFDAAGNKSSQSTILTYTTPVDNTNPSGAPSNLNVTEIKNTTARLTWTAGTDDVGVAGYEISGNNGFITITVTGTSRLITLEPDSTYNLTIRTVDAAGNKSSVVMFDQFTTLGDEQNPESPTGINVGYNASTSKYKVIWNKSFDNDQVVEYEIRDAADNSVIKVHPASIGTATIETVDVDESEINGKKIYIVAQDRSENYSAHSVKLLVDNYDGVFTSGITSVSFSGMFTKGKAGVNYVTTTETRMTLKVYQYSDGEKGTVLAGVNGTIQNNILTKAGSKTINIPAAGYADGSYYVEYIVTNSDGSQSRKYAAILTVTKAMPVIIPDTGTKQIVDGWGSGETEVPETTEANFSYTLSKNSTVSVLINDSKRSTVKTIKSNYRMLATESGQSHEFSWDGTDNNGNAVADGTYTVVYTGTDALALKAAQKTQTVRVERNKPVITLLTTHSKPSSNLTINFNVSELATVYGAFKLCSNDFIADTYTVGSTQYPTDTCTPVTGASVSATGLLKIGNNKFNIKLPSSLAPGTYYLMMRVRDTAGTQGIQTLTVATAKSNDVVKFPLIIDGTNPAITDASATNVVGNGSSTISYELSETALVTVTIKSGATYAKSKIIATIVNNELRTVAGAEAEGFTSTWDGKDSKGKTTPNTSATVKYWVEVRALDLAGNASANTLDVTYKEFTKSAS